MDAPDLRSDETKYNDARVAKARTDERERCAKLVDARAQLWNNAAKVGMHSDCSMSLAEECEDIAAAIRRGDKVVRERAMPFDEEELDPHGECAAEIHRLQATVDRLLTAGNHIATYRTEAWPDYRLDGLTRDQQCESALRTLGAGREYDMWCCWSAMMQTRDDSSRGDDSEKKQ